MARFLIWMDDAQDKGWACSNCDWRFPLPALLQDEEARKAYDRLGALKFKEHACKVTASSQWQAAASSRAPPGNEGLQTQGRRFSCNRRDGTGMPQRSESFGACQSGWRKVLVRNPRGQNLIGTAFHGTNSIYGSVVPPPRGSERFLAIAPTAYAVGFIRAPLRGRYHI